MQLFIFFLIFGFSFCSQVDQPSRVALLRLQHSVAELQQAVDVQNAEITHLKTKMEEKFRYTPRPLTGALNETKAFSAYVSDGDLVYQPQARILYEGVQYNTGDYSPSVSIFTCETEGLYWFSVTGYFLLRASEGHTGVINLVKGSQNIGQVVSTSFGNDFNTQTTVGVISYCNQGELVFAEADEPTYVFGNAFNRRSTLVGVLLAT